MSRKDSVATSVLRDDEYDDNGWPLARLTIERHTYSLSLGPLSSWVAEFEGLPGYYGEGASPERALERLRLSLGPRPHFRVAHKLRDAKKLKADLERKHRAAAVAAQTRADGFGYNLGGGSGVDASAKAKRVGKTAVNEARARLADAIQSPDGRRVVGVSKQALQEAARAAGEREAMDVWVAEEAPWRLEHAAAREKFPTGNG